MLTKVLKYHHRIDSSYPNRLNFINRSWSVLKNLYLSDNKNYKVIFGNGKKTKDSLWSVRDQIVHANRMANMKYLKMHLNGCLNNCLLICLKHTIWQESNI
jgi:hypothetical protein